MKATSEVAKGKVAKGEKVYSTLASAILTGQLPAGTKLPPQRGTSEAPSGSSNTRRAAYARLLDQGLVRRDSRFYFVGDHSTLPNAVLAATSALIEVSRQHGVELGDTVLSIQGLWPATEDQREQNRDDAAKLEYGSSLDDAIVERPQWQLNSSTIGVSANRSADNANAGSDTKLGDAHDPSSATGPRPIDHEPSVPYWKADGWVDHPPGSQDRSREVASAEDDTTEDYAPYF
ncbi:GntR family transcriptional regulator [Cryobacterium cheniae]|uniref:GntR family transcriptional regulator n=1 Tax=Cryobacterium cheniae TaxID=1259262 RepID=A0A4R8XVS9_9MICO|nr:GntR family transcriptional regulator [Cryobacterium cheniae]TFC83305.1 GntR family transcriptional regulator [Cryobacterium cheniae]